MQEGLSEPFFFNSFKLCSIMLALLCGEMAFGLFISLLARSGRELCSLRAIGGIQEMVHYLRVVCDLPQQPLKELPLKDTPISWRFEISVNLV